MYVIGLDLGTSGVKSTLFDDRANAVGSTYREYDLLSDGDGVYELDPAVLLQKSLEVLAGSIKEIDAGEVKAICITSFGESFVCLDENDRVLSNTMIYMDTRGTLECAEFAEKFGAREIFGITGQYLDPMFSAYKIRWISKNKPRLLGKTKRMLFICDFIAYMLGAEHCCDYSLAARSALFDVRAKKWWDDALAFAGIHSSMLPKPVAGGSVTGTISRRMAETFGMNSSVKIILGGHDQILAAIGGGAGEPGDVVNGMGTVDCFTGVMDDGEMDEEALRKYNLPIVPFVRDDLYVTYSFNMSGGCIVKWFRDHLAKDIVHLPEAYRILDTEAPAEPTNLFVIPYFAGGGTPYMDDALPAVIAGLRLTTNRGELYRAFLEGETYEMKLGLDCLSEAGIPVKKITAAGGGTNSSLWMQLRADIFERDVHIPLHNQAGVLGSAMLCYTNLGLYDSILQAQKDMVRCQSVFIPGAENAPLYQKKYERYKQIYRAMKGVYS